MVPSCGVRTALGFNTPRPVVLPMQTRAPLPCTMAKALESLGSPCGLKIPPRVDTAELPLLFAHAGDACPYAMAEDVGSLDSSFGWSCGLRTGAPCPCVMEQAVVSLGSPLGWPCRLKGSVYGGAIPASSMGATNSFNILIPDHPSMHCQQPALPQKGARGDCLLRPGYSRWDASTGHCNPAWAPACYLQNAALTWKIQQGYPH